MHRLHVNGHDMAYVARGTGVPLLLLHGAMCDLRYWAPQMEAFGRRYRAIAPSSLSGLSCQPMSLPVLVWRVWAPFAGVPARPERHTSR
jgi:hypothetical protein